MKIYVICDLEGTAGVVDMRRQCSFDAEYYHQARRLATLELNALVKGAREAGVTEVVAWDGHGPFPGGLDVELLHPECRLVMGAGGGGPVGLDGSFAAMCLCGLHGMAGARHGVLAHSFVPYVEACWVNGKLFGEIAANCHLAGEQGVPTVFLSGDQAAADEARTLVPEIETAVVKQGLASPSTLLAQAPMLTLAPSKARAVICQSVKRSISLIGKTAPFRFQAPYTVRTKYTAAKWAERAAERAAVQRLDELTVELTNAERLELIL